MAKDFRELGGVGELDGIRELGGVRELGGIGSTPPDSELPLVITAVLSKKTLRPFLKSQKTYIS